MARYFCNDCRHEFKGNEFTEECSKCNSLNIEKQDSLILLFIKQHWLKAIIIFVILIILLLVTKCPTRNGKHYIYDIQFKQEEDCIDINIYKIEIDKTGKAISAPQLLNPNEAELSIIAYNMKAEDKEGQIVGIMDGNIYPCKIGDTIYVKWNDNIKFTLKNPEDNFRELLFNGKKISKKADCYEPLRILEVKALKNCSLQVITNKDSTASAKDIQISITGKAGPFKKQRKWYAKNYKRQLVVACLGSDTAYCANWNDIFQPIGCKTFTKNDIISITRIIANKANDLGANPLDKGRRNSFLREIHKPTTIFYIDDVNIGKWEHFYNSVTTMNKTYSVIISSIKIDELTGKAKEIKFNSN